MISDLDIYGLRGFATKQSLRLSQPNGQLGSGLTTIVGANNAGKSTIVEAFRALVQQHDPPSFAQGRRNRVAGDKVWLRITDAVGNKTELCSLRPGTSETERKVEGRGVAIEKLMVVPSRRAFEPFFGSGETNRAGYMANLGFPAIRTSTINQFASRLFTVQKNAQAFNSVLGKVLDPVPDWTIDLMDTGQYYLKFIIGDAVHSSEGLGEGFISLFFIIDALYDSEPGDVIVIDEPELSLHPSLQRKLGHLLAEYASDRQIIIATHSPYFVNLNALATGATVARVHLVKRQSRISQITENTSREIYRLLDNANNPHIFGTNAQEVFFLEDRVILVEGQEDVVFYDRVQESLGVHLAGNFFGWGVGGAANMERVAMLLRELGFERVVGILDGNFAHLVRALLQKFPDYLFLAIPADDVRTKREREAKPSVAGLLDDANKCVRPEYVESTRLLLNAANEFLRKGLAA